MSYDMIIIVFIVEILGVIMFLSLPRYTLALARRLGPKIKIYYACEINYIVILAYLKVTKYTCNLL